MHNATLRIFPQKFSDFLFRKNSAFFRATDSYEILQKMQKISEFLTKDRFLLDSFFRLYNRL